jgi:hypothetical protein
MYDVGKEGMTVSAAAGTPGEGTKYVDEFCEEILK